MNKPSYKDGYDFFEDMRFRYGPDMAFDLARRYLKIPLPSREPDLTEEKKFRNELVAAALSVGDF